MNGRRLLKLFPALALAACSGEITQPPMEDARGTAYGFAPGAPTIEEFEVCKTYRGAVGPAVTVDWSVERQSGQPGASGSVVLNDGQCTTVYTYSNDAYSDGGLEVQTVTVTERPVPGYTTSYVLSSKASQTVDPVVGRRSRSRAPTDA